MTHETPLSSIVFQKPNGETGELELHDSESLHSIADGSITSEKIDADAITADKIADGAVNMEHIADGSISEDKFSPELKEAWDSQSQLFRIESGSKAYTIVANAADGLDIPIPDVGGYTPVSITQWASHNNSVSTLMLTVDKDHVGVTLRNYTGVSQSGTYYVRVLYLRDPSANAF